MNKLFTLNKHKDYIEVVVELEKKYLAKDPKIVVRTKEVLEFIEKECPALCLEFDKENSSEKVTNFIQPHKGTWIFFKKKKVEKQPQPTKINNKYKKQKEDKNE